MVACKDLFNRKDLIIVYFKIINKFIDIIKAHWSPKMCFLER